MPPRVQSRHSFTLGFKDRLAGREELQLSEREPFPFQLFDDNVQHVVGANETLGILAARYFASLSDPALLWWVIADFQPDPIHDPTVALAVGSVIIIPSVRTVTESIFSPKRRGEGGL
jgi:hypothetical protein